VTIDYYRHGCRNVNTVLRKTRRGQPEEKKSEYSNNKTSETNGKFLQSVKLIFINYLLDECSRPVFPLCSKKVNSHLKLNDVYIWLLDK